jgi:hypothetical protein
MKPKKKWHIEGKKVTSTARKATAMPEVVMV